MSGGGILHLAAPSDAGRLLPMVAAMQAEAGVEADETQREDAILPLLEGSPLGAVWLIGPQMAPVGFVIVTFGWSMDAGGMDGVVDRIWIREKVRGRGMGTEALAQLLPTLSEAGLKALHLEVGPDNERALRLYKRWGFRMREAHRRMTWRA